ncbi:hypothetical protein ACWJJH_12050 [Endozoicomonadaceae bacterium StTr2]
MSSTAFSYAALAFASAFGLFLLISQYRSFAAIRKVPAKIAVLGFGILTATATLGLLRYGFSDRWVEAHDLFANLGWYMAMPLIGATFLDAGRDMEWSKPTWWRIILGLCLIFEVARMMGWQAEYKLVANLTAALAATLAVCWPKSDITSGSRLFTLAGVVSCVVAAVVIGTEGQLIGYLREDVFRYMVALGTLCLGSGLFFILQRRIN